MHAANSLLQKVSQVQTSFLNKLGVSEKDAFLTNNFAPTELRRNIGILGLLHKRVLGLCHRSFDRLLPWRSERFHTERGFGHSKQLYGHRLETKFQSALFFRSIFAMADVYNNLSQSVVDAPNVKLSQKHLTDMARERCRVDRPQWPFSFSSRHGPDTSGTEIT